MADFTVLSPQTVYIEEGAVIGEGAVIYPFNVICGRTVVGRGAVLYPFNFLRDCTVGEGAEVSASFVCGAAVGAGAKVGPYAHLRTGADVGRGCRVGNFVELKNCTLGEGAKAAHLAYIGDAAVGRATNIGCGAIFCNYDGRQKHRTEVGEGCFIGSNVNLVAPLTLGDGCFVAAGTTVTRPVPAGAFVIGRARQQESAALAEKYLPR